MPFKLANHGGRYLYVNDENEIQEDRDYNLSLSPKELAAKGSVFDMDSDNNHQLVSERGPVQFKPQSAGRPCNLQLEQINSQEYVIKADTRRNNQKYVYSKLDSLDLQDQPGPMAVFTAVQQQDQQQANVQDQAHHHGHQLPGQHQYQEGMLKHPQGHQQHQRRYSAEQQYEQLQAYLHGQRMQ